MPWAMWAPAAGGSAERERFLRMATRSFRACSSLAQYLSQERAETGAMPRFALIEARLNCGSDQDIFLLVRRHPPIWYIERSRVERPSSR
jgi:hypothetical protein